jgi:hypothetical protein
MRAWGISTINLGIGRVNMHGRKANSHGKGEQFLHAFFGTTRENRVLEPEDNHSGHVWQWVRAVKS